MVQRNIHNYVRNAESEPLLRKLYSEESKVCISLTRMFLHAIRSLLVANIIQLCTGSYLKGHGNSWKIRMNACTNIYTELWWVGLFHLSQHLSSKSFPWSFSVVQKWLELIAVDKWPKQIAFHCDKGVVRAISSTDILLHNLR